MPTRPFACAVVAGALLVACSSSPSVVQSPNAPASSAAGSASPPPASPAATVAHVGAAVTITGLTGEKATITLQQLIDPAQGGDILASPDAGKRFVGAKFLIANAGSGSLSDDANNDATLQGSDQQSYTSDVNAIAGCTNFSEGQYTLAPGASVVGCVTFQLPTGVTAARAQFNISSGFGGQTAQWEVP